MSVLWNRNGGFPEEGRVYETNETLQIDPAITRFEEQCEREGLVCDSCWVPAALRAQVRATQTWPQRARWFFSGYWCVCVCVCVCMCACLPVCLSVCLSFCLSVTVCCLSLCIYLLLCAQ